MKEEDFQFSLYPNDLILVKKASGAIPLTINLKDSTLPPKIEKSEVFLYYRKSGIAGATIVCDNHDGSYYVTNLGIKTLASIEKYQVDVLGNYYKVGKERRQSFR